MAEKSAAGRVRSGKTSARGAAPAMSPRLDVLADLRDKSDDELATLLRSRPELLHPIAPDLERLASRLLRPESLAAALQRLDLWTLQVLEALAIVGPTTVAELARTMAMGAKTPINLDAETEAACALLAGLVLITRSNETVAIFPEVLVALGPYPAGLGPSVATAHPEIASLAASEGRLAELLEQAPAGARAALERLAGGPPVGRVADAQRIVTIASAKTPIEWLLAQGLLIAIGPDEVVLPREVGLALRHGIVISNPQPEPPTTPGSSLLPPTHIEQASGLTAYRAVHDVVRLLDAWTDDPPGVLRNGGLGMRDLAEAARLLDRDERSTALIIEAAFTAGLVAADDADEPKWLPTPTFDLWQAKDVAEQWAVLVFAWATGTRTTTLDIADVPNPLSPRGEHATVPALRLEALECLATDIEVTPESIQLALAWRLPRAAATLRDAVARATVADGETWGLVVGTTASRAVSTLVRVVASGGRDASGRMSVDPELVAAIASVVPEPVDHMLLQADLTAIVPGPPEGTFARELAVLADLESTGGASVYRLSEASIRRALDLGWAANDVQALLQRRSRTPVPQSLSTLIDDIARRHGAVRVGRATSYIRSDDPAALATVLTHRATQSLGLRLLAPTVAVSAALPDEIITSLRAAGLAPAIESLDGIVVLPDSERRRAQHRPRPTPATRSLVPDDALIAAAVRALRAGEHIAAQPPKPEREHPTLERTTSAEVVVALRTLVQRGGPILLGYASGDGSTTERVVEPIRLDGGRLLGIDRHTDRVTHFSVARITGVASLAVPDEDILTSEGRT